MNHGNVQFVIERLRKCPEDRTAPPRRLTGPNPLSTVRNMQSRCSKFLRGLTTLSLGSLVSLTMALAACTADDDHDDHDDHDHDDHGHDHDHENEIISRVELSFTPVDGGDALMFAFDDPDGDGGMSGSAERVELTAGTSYTLTVKFENGLVDPPEDITAEVEEESEEHFVFVTGDVSGPASASANALLSHEYADLESDYGSNAVGDDLPVGLRNTVTAVSAGSGQLRLMLRHLPELNGAPQKSGDLPQAVADGEDLPGSVDVDVVFDLMVQ